MLGFVLASLVTIGFLIKFTLSMVFWSNNRDAIIEPWMPIGFIARSYEVDRDWLYLQTGLTPEETRRRMTISEAAALAGTSYLEMRDQILFAIKEHRAK